MGISESTDLYLGILGGWLLLLLCYFCCSPGTGRVGQKGGGRGGRGVLIGCRHDYKITNECINVGNMLLLNYFYCQVGGSFWNMPRAAIRSSVVLYNTKYAYIIFNYFSCAVC